MSRFMLPLIAGWMVLAQSASATVIYYTGFEASQGYSVGDIHGQNGWTAPSMYEVASGGLATGSGPTALSGGSQKLIGKGSEFVSEGRVSIDLPVTVTASTVYIGVTYSFTYVPDIPGQTTQDIFWWATLDGDTNDNNSIGMTARLNDFYARVRNSSTSFNSATGAGFNPPSQTVNYRFVVKISKGSGGNYETSSLFVNPTSFIEGTPNATVTADSGRNSLTKFWLRTGTFLANISSAGQIRFDDLMISTDYATAVMPEPASATLLGLIGGLMLLRRRG